jgi:hypothetical protein
MKCSDLQFNLSLHADGFLTEGEAVSIKEHLGICPLCRQKNFDYREIRSDLRQLRSPEISENLIQNLKYSIRNELRAENHGRLRVSSDIGDWLQMRVMPYSVGVFASLLIGVTFLTMMFSGMLKNPTVPVSTAGRDTSVMLANNSNPFADSSSTFISAVDFAHSRSDYASESPSINPQGGLVALTKSLIRGGMKDEEVVVVADVFSNGLAKISEVVESPRDRRAVDELEKALQSDPAFAPFVPAVMENRPDNMRIILKFQSVNVSTGSKPAKRRS